MKGLTLEQLKAMGATPTIAPPLDSNKSGGLTLDQIKAKGGTPQDSSLTSYAIQSANPSVSSTNPAPSFWSKIFAGTPLAPAMPSDVGGVQKKPEQGKAFDISKPDLGTGLKAGASAIGGGLVEAGKMLANIFSDAPAILAAIPQALFHPYDTAVGLTSMVGDIGAETGQALHEGFTTGDWSRLIQDTQKTEVSAINHPLQTVLLLDGALDTAKSIATKGVVGTASEFADKTATSAQTGFDSIKKVKDNIVKLFNSKTTLTEHTFNIQNQIDAGIDLQKNLISSKNIVEDFNKKSQSLIDENSKLQEQLKIEVKGTLEEKLQSQKDIQTKIEENQVKQNELKQQQISAEKKLQIEQDKAKENFQAKTNEVNKETSNQQKEFALKNGFNSSLIEMGNSVYGFFKSAFDKASGVYDQTLGNAKVDSAKIIDGLTQYKEELLKGNKFKSADVAQKEIDQLKLRQIVSEYKGDTLELFQRLQEENVNKKLYEGLTAEQLQNRYKPLTSDYLKTARNSIYNSVEKGADESSIREYNKTVNPAFDSAFGDAIKEEYGIDTLNKIKQNDANWSNLKSNPLSEDPTPSLNKIKDNWDSFVTSASKVQGGSELVSKIQNFTAEKILNDSEDIANKGTFDYKKILKGLNDYGSILDDTSKERLQRVADDNKAIVDEKAQQLNLIQKQKQALAEQTKQKAFDISTEKQKITKTGKLKTEEIQAKQSDLSEKQKALEQQQKQIVDTSSKIGKDVPDIIDNIMKIDSPEKLSAYLEKTGVNSADLGAVAVSNIFKSADVDIGLNRLDPVLDKSGNPTLDKDGKPIMQAPSFDISKVKNALADIRKLGKGDQDVQDAILGQTKEMKAKGQLSDTQQALLNLENQIKEYDTLKSPKGKTLGKRLTNIAMGTLMLTLVPIGKFFAIRKIFEGFKPDALSKLEDARARTETPPTASERIATSGAKSKRVVKRLQGATAIKTGQNQQNQ